MLTSRSPRSRRTPGSSTTRSTASWSGSPTSSARAATASWWSRPRTRASWCARGAPGSSSCARRPRRDLRRAGLRVAAGRRPEPAVPARRLGVAAARRVAHDRGPARARRARLRARARAVRAQRGLGRAAPLARAERRHASTAPPSGFVSTQVARRVVELLFGRLDGRTASFTRHARPRGALLPRRLPGDPPRRRPARTAPTPTAAPPGDRVLGRGGARRAAALPARAAAAAGGRSTGAPRSGCATPASRARRLAAAAAARPRASSPGPADGSEAQHLARAADRGGGLGGHGARAAAACCARWPAAPCRWPRGCRSTRRRCDDGELGLLFEPRDALTLAAQLERLIADAGAARATARAGSSARTPSSSGRARPTRSRSSTPRSPRAATRPTGNPERAQAAGRARRSCTWTCTCTPTTRPTARRRWTRCSRRPRRRGPRRDRGHRPQRGVGRARGARAAPTGSR